MYSQHEEEKYILEAVGDLGEGGIFLDIGAYDGMALSNSLALVERGWDGVLVEANPVSFGALLQRHGPNTRLALVQALVGLQEGLVPFWSCDMGDMVSTTDVVNFNKWMSHARFGPKYYAPMITLRHLIETFPLLEDADVVSIDTEGTSVDLFLDFPIETVKPKVFVVEYDDKLDALMTRSTYYGYKKVYQSEENVVLVRG